MPALTRGQWQEISPYLDRALTLSDQERMAWLETLRAEQPKRAQLLEQLLDEHRSANEEHFLNRLPVDVTHPSFLEGQQIGPYKLLSKIGQGGMGSVWLGERNDGRFDRQVAIKFLNLAVTSAGSAERFKREGKLLGKLADPHIAELIDAGVTPNGETYLVLEYVDGENIDEYCVRGALDVNARVRVFLDVLGAVAHAHANLIVHRDIKPSNVLVRSDGQVKLLDFGIAKLLSDDENPAAAKLTVEHGSSLTPQFAAPEQLTGAAITTATDVYSLGVLLYLLLSGQHPAGPGASSAAALIKAIVETEPQLVSEMVAIKDDRTQVQERSGDVEKLRKQLRGDLDTIVSKALKKNPHERYASVAALAADLTRYLRHEPINARPDTFSYRASKFVRRNRAVTALSGLTIIAVIGGAIGILLQAHTARKQRDFAFRELARADRLNNLNEFLLTDSTASGKSITANDLLDRARHIVEQENYASDPANHVKMLVSLGSQYHEKEENDQALSVLQEGYRLSGEVQDPSARAQASCALASALYRSGDQARARALIDEGLRELPNDAMFDLDRVGCHLELVDVALSDGAAQEAVAQAELSQRLLRESPIQSKTLEMLVQLGLGSAYNSAGKQREALAAFEHASSLLKDLGYGDTNTAVTLLNNWALTLMIAGRTMEGEAVYRQAVNITQANGHVEPMLMINYAGALREMGRLPEAQGYADKAYEKVKELKDQNVLKYAVAEQLRGYRDQHDYARAGAKLDELEGLYKHDLKPGHYGFAALASERSMLAEGEGDISAALRLADEAVALDEAAIKAGGQGAHMLPMLLLRRSSVELKCQLSQKAEDDAARAVKLDEVKLQPGSHSSVLGRAYVNLGKALMAEGKSNEARQAFRVATEHLEATLGQDHQDSQAARQLAGL